MVDPRMAQATAVHTNIAMIATIRFNMVVCLSTLSAATPKLARLVGIVKYFSLQSGAFGSSSSLPVSFVLEWPVFRPESDAAAAFSGQLVGEQSEEWPHSPLPRRPI